MLFTTSKNNTDKKFISFFKDFLAVKILYAAEMCYSCEKCQEPFDPLSKYILFIILKSVFLIYEHLKFKFLATLKQLREPILYFTFTLP